MKGLNKRKCKFCKKEFQKIQPLQPYCSQSCANKAQKEREAGKPKKKFIAPVSEKRLKQLAEYRVLRKEFLSREENQICPVMWFLKGQVHKTTEIHHTNGRENDLLNDVEFWLAVSRDGHTWIHLNPKKSREKGWLL
jgi:Fe-S-cluster-containing dehydrogenase component